MKRFQVRWLRPALPALRSGPRKRRDMRRFIKPNHGSEPQSGPSDDMQAGRRAGWEAGAEAWKAPHSGTEAQGHAGTPKAHRRAADDASAHGGPKVQHPAVLHDLLASVDHRVHRPTPLWCSFLPYLSQTASKAKVLQGTSLS